MSKIAKNAASLEVLFKSDVTEKLGFFPVAQTDEPTGQGVIDLSDGKAGKRIALIFFGSGEPGQMAVAHVTGWRMLAGEQPLWIPVPILNLNLTLSPQVGVNGTSIDALHRFVGTIDAPGIFTTDATIVTPRNGRIAEARFGTDDFQRIQVQLAVTDASSINAIAQRIS